jgi:hypothetical protein
MRERRERLDREVQASEGVVEFDPFNSNHNFTDFLAAMSPFEVDD